MDFKDFKTNKTKLAKLTKKLIVPTDSYSDSRFWALTKDDAGNGEALIRFLPQKDVEKNPFVLMLRHFFKEKGKYFVEKCPVVWDKQCPICDYVQPFWDGTEDDKKIASKYGRKKQYTANIFVIKDPAKPENNNKVFLYKFGTKIFTKILNKINPKSELDTEITVYDLWEGMDFKLKIKKVYGFSNYDDSEFSGIISPIKKTDKEIEEVYNTIYNLDEFINPKDCKNPEELSKRFFKIIGKTSNYVKESAKTNNENEFNKTIENKNNENEKTEEVKTTNDKVEDEISLSNDDEIKDTSKNDEIKNNDDEEWDW